MRLLCRYAGGLACLVTVLALVACGGGPGSQPEPKQIGDIAFQQGEKVRTIPLSDKFNGTDLTYSATTSARSVATVTVDNDKDTLTVTVVGTGTATITVTAKNSDGEAKQTFTVTVPKPPTAPDPEPVDIPDIPSLEKDATSTIPLGDKFSGENLTYSASSSHEHVVRVTVDNTANTLTLTAVGPGQAIITVTATATAQGSTSQTKTFTVTVPQPASEATAPTVKTGATSTVSVAVGATSTVALSTVFDRATSYTATSSASTIATASGASTSSGTLTITGVSTGPATITIVATNDAGDATHQIEVTVSEPATTPTSSELTLEIGGPSAKRTLPAGQTLQPPSSGGVKVERSPDGETGNVWVITAKKKGIHTVTILSAGKPVGTITVTVPNRAPVRQDQVGEVDLENPLIDLSATPGLQQITLDGTAVNGTPTPIHGYFDDPDKDTLYFRIANQPSWFLIETHNGFVKDAVVDASDTPPSLQLSYEVLQEVKGRVDDVPYEFTVTLYASDGEEESARPVVIELNIDDDLSPVKKRYDVNQDSVTADFTNAKKVNPPKNRLDVGPRRGVTHTVWSTEVTVTGFVFANQAAAKLVTDGLLGGDTPSFTVTTENIFYQAAGTASATAVRSTSVALLTSTEEAEDTNFFIIKSTGAVVVEPGTELDESIVIGNTSRVPFKLKEQGGSGTITIEYYVWALTRKHDPTRMIPVPDGDPRPEVRGDVPTTKKRYSKTLTINVVTCSSPPDPITACP